MLDFAVTTDYVVSDGSPEEYLRRIAAAGWKFVHWCHQWDSDFLYDADEIAQSKQWLLETGLQVLDIHGSNGKTRRWDSADEGVRVAGVALVRNRIEMAEALGCGVVIMHPARRDGDFEAFRRSVDELLPDCRTRGVRLAMENMAEDNFDQLEKLMQAYPRGLVGICYDPGHGCIAGNGLDRLEKVLDRLIAVHLNDNDGKRDLHQPLFMGKVDWPRLAGLIARSGYDRDVMSVEVVIKHSGFTDENAFLVDSLKRAGAFGAML